MRLTNSELTGLFSKPGLANAVPAPKAAPAQPRRCGREVARANELKCMKMVAHYGHARPAEIARFAWPTARYGEQVARRTLRRLVSQGLLLERRNALGSRSVCVTRAGAAWLDLRGVPAQQTLELSSVAGPTFFHRTMATRYLVERQVAGFQVAGEYLMLRRQLPFSIDALSKALKKMPDGLIWQRSKADGTVALELLEVEVSRKPRAEIEACLSWASYVGTQHSADSSVKVAGVVFVFDRSLNHAKRLLLAANSLWGGRPLAERVTLERRVKLVAVEMRDPLVWVGYSVTTLHELRERRV